MKFRWLTFNLVGALGFVLQLAALWILTDYFGLHYLLATLAATELAIISNFFCHECWTWSDRPADASESLRRAVRFHAANGVVSLAGGALLMPLLVEVVGMHYLVANLITVGICSAANFVSADRVVFRTGTALLAGTTPRRAPLSGRAIGRTPPHTGAAPVALIVLALLSIDPRVHAAELRPETLDAFNRYVRATESRMDGELRGDAPFLRVDRLPEAERAQAYSRLHRGDTLIEPLITRDRGKEIEAPKGLIHHWVGTTFAPRATVDRAIALMQGYDRYQEIYSPNVRKSHTISRQGDTFKVYLQLFMKKVISVVLNSEYDVKYMRLSPTRAHVRSYSTRIAEVHDPGEAGEKEAPVGQDSGYLWRFDNYCSVDQRAEGAYIQCESVSLSRAIPTGLGWLVGPFVTSIPRESLEFTLSRMRKTLG